MPVIDASDIKEFLGGTFTGGGDDAALTSAAQGISNAVARYCRRKTFDEVSDPLIFSGDGDALLLYPLTPIASIASIAIDPDRAFPASTQVPSASIEFDADAGIIELFDGYCFTKGRRNIKVTATSGYQTDAMPDDLKLAAKLIAAEIFKVGKKGRSGNASKSFQGGSASFLQHPERWPPRALQLLDPFMVTATQE